MRWLLTILIFLSSFFFAGAAGAAVVVDVYDSDLMVIDIVTSIFDSATPAGPRTGINIAESYTENTLVSYTPQDGYAIVNGNQQFFDKTIRIEASDDWANGWSSMYVNLQITNNTNYAWSGYHLEFWNADFTSRFPITLLAVNTSPLFGNDIFDESTDIFFGRDIDFRSDTFRQNPGETNNIWFRWDWGNPLDYHGPGTALGIRQFATTILIPSADAGPDQVICNEICVGAILDGRKSFAASGEIVSYEWKLRHTENPSDDKTATGVTPTIIDPEPGTYEVTLTITDSEGLTDTDEMELKVLDTCNGCNVMKGDLDADGDVDGDDLEIFSDYYGQMLE